MAALALLLLSVLPHSEPIRERCDLIEINGFYDEQGRHVFDQQIFYDWTDTQTGWRYQVRAWRLVKKPEQLPEWDWERDCWRATWQDGDALRIVEAPAVRRTWLQYDPELAEREHLPHERRRGLIQPKAKVFP